LNKAKLNRFLEIFIALAFVAVLVYVVSVTVRVTTGISKTTDPPANQVRLQVLNGCGETGLASRVSDQLSGYRDEDLEIKVVDAGNFEVMEVPQSFLISRVKNTSAAAVLARKLGLDPSGIEYKPLENNYRHVTVTLVLGLDHPDVLLQKKQREN
jgi:hypothetical protein